MQHLIYHLLPVWLLISRKVNKRSIDCSYAIGRLTFDLSLVSDWGRANLVLFNASKTQFLQVSTRHSLPDNYPLFFNDTKMSFSSTLNALGLSFTKNLNWQSHISTLAKSASKKLDVLWRLRPFFYPSQLLSLYKGLTLVNSGTFFLCLFFHLPMTWTLSKEKKSVKTPLILKWTSNHYFYFSYCPLHKVW